MIFIFKHKFVLSIITFICIVFFLGLQINLTSAQTDFYDHDELSDFIKYLESKYNLHDIIIQDLNENGQEEVVVVFKGEGTSALLSYQVWKKGSEGWEVWYHRENLYRGKISVESNRILEKVPLYKEGEANALPAKFIEREYVFSENKYELLREEEKMILRPFEGGGWVNPPREEIEEMLRDIALEKGIPPVIVKAVAYTESNLRQFHNGEPLQSFDDVSWGIMQVTPHIHTQFDEERLKYDIEYNIRAGVEVLLEKWSWGVSSVIPKIGSNDPRILENWYFAIWAYNGWSSINNPNVRENVYQMKVLGFAQTQFNQKITPVPQEELPMEGLPSASTHFSTPEPSHWGEYLVYEQGDIVMDMSSSGLTLRNDSWQYIKRLSPGTAMEVLDGPVLHNGYIRYKIKTIGTEGSDYDIGWVAMNWLRKESTSEIIMGDVNGDGVVDVRDAILVLRHIVGLEELKGKQLESANVSGQFDEVNNPIVGLGDAILILRHAVGIITISGDR